MEGKSPFHIIEYLDGKRFYVPYNKKDYGPFGTIEEANAAAKALFDRRKSENLMKDRMFKVYDSEGMWLSMFIDEE